jgi:hypothetical protein
MVLRSRLLVLFVLAGLMGAAVAVLPALAAGSSAPSEVKLEVVQNCFESNWPCWNPQGNPESNVPESEVPPFKLAQGGTISFEDKDTKASTDVIWKGAAPSCTPKVPSTPENSWSSTCTFANAGEYAFESQDLFDEDGSNYTQYKVIVETTGGGGTTPTTPTTTTPTTTTPTTPSEAGSPLMGGPKALELAGSQRGSTVRGSIEVSEAGSGGRLEVGLFAAGASLAKAGHTKQVRVGRLVRSSLRVGSVSFSIPLNAKGKAALHRRRRLTLTVKITLTPLHGAAVRLTRGVVVRV